MRKTPSKGAAYSSKTPRPCDGCAFATDCRDQHLACGAFRQWVFGRNPVGARNPSSDIYKEIYSEEAA